MARRHAPHRRPVTPSRALLVTLLITLLLALLAGCSETVIVGEFRRVVDGGTPEDGGPR